jgi:hypothetical protein
MTGLKEIKQGAAESRALLFSAIIIVITNHPANAKAKR